MTLIQQRSLIILLLVFPFSVLAVSRAEVPTSIQVMGADGSTLISTSTTQRVLDEPRAPFPMPTVCLPFLEKESVKHLFPSITEGHPLRTRIESQHATLRLLVDELSFAPYLSHRDEDRLKEHLLSLEQGTEVIDCLLLLEDTFRAQSGVRPNNLSQRIKEIILGLHYGLRNLSLTQIEPPENIYEALYAGDLLASECPLCTSISLTENSMEIRFFLPVRIFGRWEKTATIAVLGKNGTITIATPWWISLGSHRLSHMKDRITTEVFAHDEGVAHIFIFAQKVIHIISS